MRYKLLALIAVIAATASLSGCVVYPARGGYGYGGPDVYVAPPPIVVSPGYYGGWGYYGGHRRRW